MADIIQIADHRPVGNGGREAVEDYFREFPNGGPIGDLIRADHFLVSLWIAGFKVVPLDDA